MLSPTGVTSITHKHSKKEAIHIPFVAESRTPYTKKCCNCEEAVNYISFCSDGCKTKVKKYLQERNSNISSRFLHSIDRKRMQEIRDLIPGNEGAVARFTDIAVCV